MKTTRTYKRWTVLSILLVPLIVAGFASAEPTVKGRIETKGDIRILTVWGTHAEQGYAHGYLMGNEIMELFRACVVDGVLTGSQMNYEWLVRRGFLKQFVFQPDQLEELGGILQGMQAKLGKDKMQLTPWNRSLDLDDLKAINVIPDIGGVFCSSFSVWGELSLDGGMITARNLDYIDIKPLRISQFVAVRLHQQDQLRISWMTVTWPGSIGAFTAINRQGVTVSMHDAPGLKPTSYTKLVPRALALRRIMEEARAGDAVTKATDVLKESSAIMGNNIHVSSPAKGAVAAPAAVIEYDGYATAGSGISLVTSDHNKTPATSYALCTNHYRVRSEPIVCWRFREIEDSIELARSKNTPFTFDSALLLIRKVSVKRTLHQVIFMPDVGKVFVALFTDVKQAGEVNGEMFVMEDLFR